jgi:hypothetical protein
MPCVCARITRRSSSSMTLVYHPISSLSERACAEFLLLHVRLIRSAGACSRLCLRLPYWGANLRTYVLRASYKEGICGIFGLTLWSIKEVWELSRAYSSGWRVRLRRPSACRRDAWGLSSELPCKVSFRAPWAVCSHSLISINNVIGSWLCVTTIP